MGEETNSNTYICIEMNFGRCYQYNKTDSEPVSAIIGSAVDFIHRSGCEGHILGKIEQREARIHIDHSGQSHIFIQWIAGEGRKSVRLFGLPYGHDRIMVIRTNRIIYWSQII